MTLSYVGALMSTYVKTWGINEKARGEDLEIGIPRPSRQPDCELCGPAEPKQRQPLGLFVVRRHYCGVRFNALATFAIASYSLSM